MRYSECIDYLNRLGHEVPVAKFRLENMRKLLEALGNPERRYPSVLIAGTNGKGSVAAFLTSILASAGVRTALYTSPHLVNVEERIAINGQNIAREAFAESVTRTVETVHRLDFSCHPTFFETVTSSAFLYFAEEEVDIAVVEAGMGGRTDSTNVLEPILSVITPVSIDHQQYLGETIEEIAYEKAGIIHRRGTVISAMQRPEVRAVLEQEALKQRARLSFANDGATVVTSCVNGRYRFAFDGLEFAPSLHGRHQVSNAVLAISGASLLKEEGYSIAPNVFVQGVNQAYIPGRIQKISDSPAIFLDGAHNDEALVKLVEFVSEHTRKPRSLVFTLMSDKRLSASIPRLAQCFDKIFLTRPSSSRAAIREQLLAYFPNGIWMENPVEALNRAKGGAETVVVTGSLYLVGEIAAFYCGRPLESPATIKSPPGG